MGLSVDDRIKMLEAIAADEDVKPSTRLRALEELGKIEARLSGGAAKTEQVDDADAPDPMADLDDMEAQRRKRTRRKVAS